jgi:hypothetical protein
MHSVCSREVQEHNRISRVQLLWTRRKHYLDFSNWGHCEIHMFQEIQYRSCYCKGHFQCRLEYSGCSNRRTSCGCRGHSCGKRCCRRCSWWCGWRSRRRSGRKCGRRSGRRSRRSRRGKFRRRWKFRRYNDVNQSGAVSEYVGASRRN